MVTTAACRKCGSEVPADAAFCQKCGAKVGRDDGPEKLLKEIEKLRARVADLQEVVDNNAEVQEQIADIIKSSAVYHDKFWPRSLAIWGHAMVWSIGLSLIFAVFAGIFG